MSSSDTSDPPKRESPVRHSNQFFVFVTVTLSTGLLSLLGSHSLVANHHHNVNDDLGKQRLAEFTKFTSKVRRKSLLKHQQCKFEGHCPVGSTCVALPESPLGGICRPFRVANSESAKSVSSIDTNDPCIKQCLDFVHWDEQFYHETAPNVTGFEVARKDPLRPPGCLVRFKRIFNHSWPGFDYPKWKNLTKRKRIVRVDPIGPKAEHARDQEWAAFCFSPCRKDLDCASTVGFSCVDSVCKRKEEEYWKANDDPDAPRDMVFVSGADSSYFGGLTNLAASIRYWAPKNRMVVYNLGMTANQLATVKSWKNVIALKWPDGIPDTYPPHVHRGKQYAWKPLAINESLHEYKNIFWLDAGSTLVGPATEVERIIEETGMFLVKGQDTDMKKKSNPLTYQYLGVNKTTFQAGPHFSGGTQAHMYPSRYVDTIVKPNAACALEKDCIVPAGSSLGTHRYDQTVYSILAYMPNVRAPHHTEYLAASKSQLKHSLKEKNDRFVIWTARQGCKFYAEMGV